MDTAYPTSINALSRPDAPALVFAGGSLTHRALEASALAAARALAAHGVGAGDRVALLPSNTPPCVALVHAVPRLEAVLVPLHVRLADSEIRGQLARVAPKLLVHTAATAGRARSLAASGTPCIAVEDLVAPAPPAPPQAVSAGAPSVAFDPGSAHTILFTSGSTGRPKAVVLSFDGHMASARASAEPLGVTGADRWLLCLPISHVGGLAVLLRGAILGFTVVLAERFDAAAVWRTLREESVTIASLVPEMLDRLLSEEPGARAPQSLRTVLLGGGPAPAALLRAARSRGFRVSTTYGLTETASQVTTLPWNAEGRDGDDCGPPIPGTEVRIAAEGAEGASGEGEILVRGPTLMRGYYDDPEATHATFEHGWLRTGDIGRWSARGGLVVLARRSDLFVSGGENVSPAEIEAVLCAHPDVAGAIVCGVPDERWGRVPAAVVVLRTGAPATGPELMAFAGEHLARFKVPGRFLFVDRLPLSASGKPDRAAAAALLDPERNA